ncbi:cellulase family glycosylhydrolase [Bacillus alkalicola]|uniref:cellulase n=1 Tax=Evansella alkalicola TaxID=745819 RepID=A0ABS6JY02_9BACI|nr:cellulase family glycosylhydrolase [Bacillus alkalicola]
MKKKYVRYFSIFMTVLLIGALFVPAIGAEESSDEEEDPIVAPLPIEERPHESNYDAYPSLLDSGVSDRRPSTAGALEVKEVDGVKTLVDESGTPIQLRGMSTHGLQWFGEIVNDNAFSALANDWDSNMIRLAMYVGETGYATNPEMKDLVVEGIELAFKHDMYVIVDWHVHAPGDPRADVYSGAYEFFEELADDYKDHPKSHYIIWELANEPSSNSNGGPGIPNDEEGWEAVKEYADPIVEMLREKGDNIILVGSPNWSQRPDLAADNPIEAENIMYSVHFYTGTHHGTDDSYPDGTPSEDRSNVMANARYALENGVAVFATEWGVSEASGDNGPFLNEADIWLNFLNENNISWANWSLTNKNETSGSFIPFVLNETNATDLDPGDDQVWEIEELSVSGEYVRARIKGIEYEPIDRTPREDFTEVIWDFNDGTTQGFGVNSDSPVEATLENANNTLKITGLDASNDLGAEGEAYWGNLRISADSWGSSVDLIGAEQLKIDVLVENPTTVAMAAIPQSSQYGWANPANNSIVEESDFEESEDGLYKATITITRDDSPNLDNLATDPEGSVMNNIILFIGTDNADVIYLDNIAVSGNREFIPDPVEHDPIGEATLPSDFEDGTRQGWQWSSDSGVRTELTIKEANGSNALSWEYAYPEVKPGDGWASAPRLDFWYENLVRGDNEFVAFDFYLDPVEGRATEGEIEINLTFQPPSSGYWAQSDDVFIIDLENLSEATITEDGLYHFEVEIDMTNIENLQDDTELRNMLLIFADVESDFAGRVFVDNIGFDMSLEKKVEVLEKQVLDLVLELEAIEASGKEAIQELEAKIADLEAQLSALQDEAVSKELEELQQLVQELLDQIASLESRLKELEDLDEDPPNGDHSDGDDESGGEPGTGEGTSGSSPGGTSNDGKTADGEKLPDTATNMFNYLLLGLLLLVAGIVVYVKARKTSIDS